MKGKKLFIQIVLATNRNGHESEAVARRLIGKIEKSAEDFLDELVWMIPTLC
jgi:hypothetical protein